MNEARPAFADGRGLASPQDIYDLTQVFVAPFHGIFNTAASGCNAFEPEALVAIVIYSLIGWGLAKLVRITTKAGAPES